MTCAKTKCVDPNSKTFTMKTNVCSSTTPDTVPCSTLMQDLKKKYHPLTSTTNINEKSLCRLIYLDMDVIFLSCGYSPVNCKMPR